MPLPEEKRYNFTNKIKLKSVKLNDGTFIVLDDNGWGPPLQEVKGLENTEPCEVCPDIVEELCARNNSFDCKVYGMFQGFYSCFDDFCKFVIANNLDDKRRYVIINKIDE